jgi:hypothetical protein
LERNTKQGSFFIAKKQVERFEINFLKKFLQMKNLGAIIRNARSKGRGA